MRHCCYYRYVNIRISISFIFTWKNPNYNTSNRFRTFCCFLHYPTHTTTDQNISTRCYLFTSIKRYFSYFFIFYYRTTNYRDYFFHYSVSRASSATTNLCSN